MCLEAIEQKRQTSKVCYNYNTQLTVLATATPIFGENGEVRYIFNNVRNITSLNNMQASLRDKEEIIRRQNKQLEDMKIRLGVGTIIANSESFRKVVELERVATFDGATVLILGSPERARSWCPSFWSTIVPEGYAISPGQLRGHSGESDRVRAVRV